MFFIKLVLLAILPLVVVLFSYLVWELIYFVENYLNSRRAKYEKVLNSSMAFSIAKSGLASPQNNQSQTGLKSGRSSALF